MIAVVAHDAGGAELVAHHALRCGEPVLVTVDGPARPVFERLAVPSQHVTLDEAVARASWVLCGTSWQSDLEWRAMRRARATGRRVVAFLDHWTEYVDRFVRHSEPVRPDEVWVTDQMAKDIADRVLGGVPVVVAGNPYLDALEADARSRGLRETTRETARVILMVTEATSAHALARYGDGRHFGYTEDEAARYFLEHVRTAFPAAERIILRPHPAESPDRYSFLQSASPLPLVIDSGVPLIEHLLVADGVAGCNTMAMVAALRLGRPVVSYIPPEGPSCALPHAAIVHLRELAGAGRRVS